jgi:hypothetical protein
MGFLSTERCQRHIAHWRVRRTCCEPMVSARIISLCSITLSATSLFQKQTKPVPRERSVPGSTVIRAYRRAPNVRNLHHKVLAHTGDGGRYTYSARSSSSVAIKGILRMKSVVPVSV